jgi:hypothetical protein
MPNGGFSFGLADSINDLLGRWSNQRLLKALIRPEAMAYDLAPLIWSTANDWTQNTEWGGKVNVNGSLQPGYINIYIVKQQYVATHNFSNLRAVCPCEFLVGTNAIICIHETLTSASGCRPAR